jgi:hypothetical protein
MTSSLLQKMDDRLDRAMDFESIVDLHEVLTMIVKDNICLTKMAVIASASEAIQSRKKELDRFHLRVRTPRRTPSAP